MYARSPSSPVTPALSRSPAGERPRAERTLLSAPTTPSRDRQYDVDPRVKPEDDDLSCVARCLTERSAQAPASDLSAVSASPIASRCYKASLGTTPPHTPVILGLDPRIHRRASRPLPSRSRLTAAPARIDPGTNRAIGFAADNIYWKCIHSYKYMLTKRPLHQQSKKSAQSNLGVEMPEKATKDNREPTQLLRGNG